MFLCIAVREDGVDLTVTSLIYFDIDEKGSSSRGCSEIIVYLFVCHFSIGTISTFRTWNPSARFFCEIEESLYFLSFESSWIRSIDTSSILLSETSIISQCFYPHCFWLYYSRISSGNSLQIHYRSILESSRFVFREWWSSWLLILPIFNSFLFSRGDSIKMTSF